MRVEVDFRLLDHNINCIRNACPDVIPVVKGNMYGLNADVAYYVAKHFDLVAVANMREAGKLLRRGYASDILILNGYQTGNALYIHPKCIYVLPYSQAAQAKEGTRYAVYLSGGCNRMPVTSEEIQKLKHKPELVIVHGSDYTKPIDFSNDFADDCRVSMDIDMSVGSGANMLNGSIKPRVGMAFVGYCSSDLGLPVSPVKRCVASVISDAITTPYVGYGVKTSDLIESANLQDAAYIYSVNVGMYDPLYSSHNNTQVVALSNRDATIVLMTDKRLRAVSMNSSFIVSDTPLAYGSKVEILGPNVPADHLAEIHGTSTADILRLGMGLNVIPTNFQKD